jgi:chaperonin GroES
LGEGTGAFPYNFHAKLKEEFNDMALVPLGDRILVKRSDNDEQTTSGGIIIPDTAKEKPQEGEVVAVGSGRLLDSGDRQPVDVAVGDLILFAKYGGTEVTYDNTEYLILREDDILAKVN